MKPSLNVIHIGRCSKTILGVRCFAPPQLPVMLVLQIQLRLPRLLLKLAHLCCRTLNVALIVFGLMLKRSPKQWSDLTKRNIINRKEVNLMSRFRSKLSRRRSRRSFRRGATRSHRRNSRSVMRGGFRI